MTELRKPSYSTSKNALWLSLAFAWAIIFILAIGAVRSGQAVAFGTIALPSMVALIVAMLGIHRGFGSLDMRTMAFNARDQPGDTDTEAAT